MSMADYKQYKQVTTGVQWKNVIFAAEVALSVALMFTPLGPANAARMFAMAGPRIALSAGQKMAGMAINGSVQTAVWELGGQKLDEGLAWSDVRWGTVAGGFPSPSPRHLTRDRHHLSPVYRAPVQPGRSPHSEGRSIG
jgi:hypothetical protein